MMLRRCGFITFMIVLSTGCVYQDHDNQIAFCDSQGISKEKIWFDVQHGILTMADVGIKYDMSCSNSGLFCMTNGDQKIAFDRHSSEPQFSSHHTPWGSLEWQFFPLDRKANLIIVKENDQRTIYDSCENENAIFH